MNFFGKTGLRLSAALGAAIFAALAARADLSEVKVSMRLDAPDFLVGERVRAVVEVVNVSGGRIAVGDDDANAEFFVEVRRSIEGEILEPTHERPFVAAFSLEPNEAQKLETFLADHFWLNGEGRYYAQPVLLVGGVRYAGATVAFDVVPGMPCGSERYTAMQMFAGHGGLRRKFGLVSWRRQDGNHIFLVAEDDGESERRWNTVDLGPLLRVTPPVISIQPGGEVIVIHRVDSDTMLRSEFWSVPDGIEFRRRKVLLDPETAGSAVVGELYRESGGVKPADRPWWKFW